MQDKEKQIVLVRETTVSSVIQDIVTFSCLVFSFWFNYKFIGGNDALDILLFITFFMMGMSHLRNYKLLKEMTEKK